MTRNPYPIGPVPARLEDTTVAIRAAGMDFTVGVLRHAGMTDRQIAREVRAAGGWPTIN